MNLYELCSNNQINSRIKFEKDINTVFDLSYFLIDFQAVVNGILDVVTDNSGAIQERIEKIADRGNYYNLNLERDEDVHPLWQKSFENEVEKVLFPETRGIADRAANRQERAAAGYKPTTSRNFNKKYRMELQLYNFSKGSLVLDLGMSLLVSLITEFIKELVTKKTGNDNIININIQNSYVVIDNSDIRLIPKNSSISNAVAVRDGANTQNIDVRKFINNILEEAEPSENIEQSVRNLFDALHKNGIISEPVSYNSKGVRTVVRDVDRFVGNFMDVRL